MANYTIEHDRPNCIGCGACAAVCEENWYMEGDGKASVKKTGLEEKEYPRNKEAADSCPVNVIHIVNKDTGEKII